MIGAHFVSFVFSQIFAIPEILVQQIKAISGMELRAPSVCDYFGACVPSMAAKLNPQGVSTSVTQKREETSWWVTADQTRPEEEEETSL